MSYPGHYPATGQQPAAGTTYPYGAYHPVAPGTYGQAQATAYPYQAAGGYPTGVTSYGAWPYPYSYVPHPQSAYTPRPALTTSTPATSTGVSATTFTPYTPAHLRESAPSTTPTTGRGSRKQTNFKGLFSKELKSLMYGFGDDRNPANDTVNVMEEILIEFIVDVCQQAGGPSKKARLSVEDLRRVLSRPADAKKLARMEELLFMQEDIKRARAQFEESDMNQTRNF